MEINDAKRAFYFHCPFFIFLGNGWMFKYSFVRSFKLLFIHPFGLPVGESFFADAFFGRIKIIDQRVQKRVYFLESGHCLIPLVAKILYGFSDHVSVFLLNETVVIGAPRPSAGKIYIMFLAIFHKILINELSAGVAVKSLDGDRKRLINVVSGLQSPFLGLILKSPDFSPAEGYIGRGKRPGVMRVDCTPAIVCNRVNFTKTGLFF